MIYLSVQVPVRKAAVFPADPTAEQDRFWAGISFMYQLGEFEIVLEFLMSESDLVIHHSLIEGSPCSPSPGGYDMVRPG